MNPLRLWCILFGCGYDDEGYCPRCHEHIYEGFHYVQRGKLEWVERKYWRLHWKIRPRLFPQKCDVCGKRIWSRLREWCCSDRCYEQWIPF